MTTSTTEKSENAQNLPDVEDKSRVTVFAATSEHAKSLSAEIAKVYEEALGKGGVQKDGHEAYPDADLFSAKGIAQILESGERLIGVAQIEEDGKQVVVGAMVADRLSPYHVEFNSMVVPVRRRGLKLGSHIVRGLADIIEQEKFTVNCTELVTHSMASQAAHFHNGFSSICGFGFCHYPHVFFKDHPESVLWVTKLQGKLVPIMRRFRGPLGRQLGRHLLDVKRKLMAAQASGQVNLASGRLDDQSLNLLSEVLKERTAYVPKRYHNLVQSILFQFEDVLDVTVKSWVRPEPAGYCADTEANDVVAADMEAAAAIEPAEISGQCSTEASSGDKSKKNNAKEAEGEGHQSLTVELKEGFAHSYIVFNQNFVFDADELDSAIDLVNKSAKRYIKVCIPANSPEALKAADYLIEKGFVFHSYLPLYGYTEQALHNEDGDHSEVKAPEFYDILSLQWIKPSVVKENPLPGETDSVIKVYGYPANLSGPVVMTIAQDLALIAGKEK